MRNLSYHNKLDLEDVFSWNQEDFSRFLVWNQVEAFKSVRDLGPGILQTAKNVMQKYNKYKFALNFYDNFFQKLCFKNNKKGKKILFQGIKFPELILESKKHFPLGLIGGGKKDRLFSLKNFIGCLSINDLHQYVYYYMKEKNIDYLYQLIEKLEEKLETLKPNYVVLWSDVFPIEKAIVLACKKLGIPTLMIQQGIYSSSSFLTDTGEKTVDYVLVWGQYFKDLYVKENVWKPEEIYVLGYPYRICKSKPKKKKKCVVYYLGQPYEIRSGDEILNKKLLDLKLKTLTELNTICKKLNIEFFYRPHPRDDRNFLKSKAPDIKFTPKYEGIFDTIAKGDIFISFKSTSLIEAAMRSKLSLQLINYPVSTDNFEKLGACAKSFQNIEQLSEYLQKIIKDSYLKEVKFEFNNYYMETRYNLGQRFVEILNQINNKQTKELNSLNTFL